MFVIDWTDVEQMVAQEWIRRDSYSTCLGRWCRCCPYGCYRRTRVMTFYVFVVSFGFFMILFLSVMGDFLVKPYLESLAYQNTTCTVVSPLAPPRTGCKCGSRCRSGFPCRGIYVTYITHLGINMTSRLRSRETAEMCLNDIFCYDPRYAGSETTSEQLEEHHTSRELMLPGAVLEDCLYNPAEPMSVIRKRNSTTTMIIHLMFWPSLLLLLCLLITASLVHVCGCRYVFVRRAPADIRAEADRRDPFRHLVSYEGNSFANQNYTSDPSDIISLKLTETADGAATDRLFTP